MARFSGTLVEQPSTPIVSKSRFGGTPVEPADKDWAIVSAAKDWYNKAQGRAQSVDEAPTIPEKALRLTGGAIGSAVDVPVELAKAAYQSSPGVVQDVLKGSAHAIGSIPVGTNVETGQPANLSDVITGIMGKYENWKKSKSPRAQANIGAVEDIASVVPVGKAVGALPKVAKVAEETAGALKESTGEALKGAAKRNVAQQLGGTRVDYKHGYRPENALKYDLVGKPTEIADKSKDILDELNAKAKEIGATSDETVNLPNVFKRVANSFDRRADPEHYDAIQAHLKEMADKYEKAFPEADVDLPSAMKLRTVVGDDAAFIGQAGRDGKMMDPDASWKEKVYTKMYNELKDELHAKGGPELQAINKQQSEIIPIRQTAINRIPAEEKKLRFGLMDAAAAGIGGVLGHGAGFAKTLLDMMAGYGVRKAMGSKTATEAMYKLGEKLSPTQEQALRSINPENYPSGMKWGE
jgi:hypothetical protein